MTVRDDFNIDQMRRKQLVDYATRAQELLIRLDMLADAEAMKRLVETVSTETFKLLVIGEFNTGKSTFINALLSADVLPSFAIETTAIINEVKWDSSVVTPGSDAYARLHFRESKRQPIDLRPVSREIFEKYVVVSDAESRFENPYSHIELFYPLALCANHVEIIDSPGLNANDVRERITLSYLNRVDAVVFVMSALKFGPSSSERASLELIQEAGHSEPFFVINMWDQLRDKDRKSVQEKATRELPQRTLRKQDAVFFISARDALEGKLEGDEAKVSASGILGIETSLHSFLANERSRIKSARAGAALRQRLDKASRTIPDKRSYLQTPLVELQTRYDNAKKELTRLERSIDQILRRVAQFRADMQPIIRGRVTEFFGMTEGLVDEWVNVYAIKPKANLQIKRQVEDAVAGLTEHLNTQLQIVFKQWTQSKFSPFILERINGLETELNVLVEHFEADLQQVRYELTSAHLGEAELGLSELAPKNALERVLAAAGGFLMFGLPGGALGAVFGLREFGRSIAAQLGIAVAAMLFSLPLLPVMIVANIFIGGKAIIDMIKTVKDRTASAYKVKLRELAEAQSNDIFAQLNEGLSQMQNTLEGGLKMQIADVEEQVQSALTDMREGKETVKIKMAEIDKAEKEIAEITTQLFDFLHELIVPQSQSPGKHT